MNLLSTIVQNEAMNRQLPARALESASRLQGFIDKRRLSTLGNLLTKWPDKSSQGLQNFARRYKVSAQDMMGLVKLFSEHQKNLRTMAGPDVPMFKKTKEGDVIKIKAQPGKASEWRGKGYQRGDITPGPKPTTKKIEYWEPTKTGGHIKRLGFPVESKAKEFEQLLINRGCKLQDPTKKEGNLTEVKAREKGYQQYLKLNNLTRSQYPIWKFKNEVWSPDKPTGELTEGAVLQNIREMALVLPNVEDPETKVSEMWNKYLEYRKTGINRADALNKVQQEYNIPKPKDDYSYLWEKP